MHTTVLHGRCRPRAAWQQALQAATPCLVDLLAFSAIASERALESFQEHDCDDDKGNEHPPADEHRVVHADRSLPLSKELAQLFSTVSLQRSSCRTKQTSQLHHARTNKAHLAVMFVVWGCACCAETRSDALRGGVCAPEDSRPARNFPQACKQYVPGLRIQTQHRAQ